MREKSFQKIIDELQTYEAFNAVAYDANSPGKWFIMIIHNPADYKKRDIAWSTRMLFW